MGFEVFVKNKMVAVIEELVTPEPASSILSPCSCTICSSTNPLPHLHLHHQAEYE